jgi:ectoine hydroxylase
MTATADPYASRFGGGSEIVRREDPVRWGDRPGPLSPAEVDAYEANGFVVLRGVLSPAEAAGLLDDAHRVAEAAPRNADHVILEPGGAAVRSVFRVHRDRAVFARLCADPRTAGAARQLLGDDVYVHQSRINFKPAFVGEPFSWHSDFETWHVEDGMPRMRALSMSVLLTENTEHNGPLLVIPGSHRWFVRCAGVTPPDHHRESLRHQRYGSPAEGALHQLASSAGVASVIGPPGTIVLFDCNLLHASAGNVTPLPRHNVFVVYNAVSNALVAPFGTARPRPPFLAERDVVPLPLPS